MKIKEQDSEHILLVPTLKERLHGFKRILLDRANRQIIIGNQTTYSDISKCSVLFRDVISISVERKEHYARYYGGYKNDWGDRGYFAEREEIHRHLEYIEWKASIVVKKYVSEIVIHSSTNKKEIYDLANKLSLFLGKNLVDEGVVIPFAETQLWDRLRRKN